MAKLSSDQDFDPITFRELVDDWGGLVKDEPFFIRMAIICKNGILLMCTNNEQYPGDVKHWIPSQRKSFEAIRNYLKDCDSTIASITIIPTTVDGREFDLLTDTKNKVQVFFDLTTNGNEKYEFMLLGK